MSEPIQIPCLSLERFNRLCRDDIKQAVNEVIDSDWFILGPALRRFEQDFAQFIECKFAIGVASGLDALRIGLLSLDIGRDDKVIIPAHTFIASAMAVSSIGATPILVDVELSTGLLDIDQLKKIDLSDVKAIMPVHLYGQACQMDELKTFAGQHGLFIVEDVSQAHGTRYKGNMLGGHGDVSAFSLYPTKNIGAIGDAGVIVTNDKALFEKAKKIRNYGSEIKYQHDLQGLNSRMSEVQAAALGVKLRYFEVAAEQRRQIAEWYLDALAGVEQIELLNNQAGIDQVRHLFVIRTKCRDALQAHLACQGIETQIHYPLPIHLHRAYQNLGYSDGAFPSAEVFCDTCLSLPFFPGLTFDEVSLVAKSIVRFYD